MLHKTLRFALIIVGCSLLIFSGVLAQDVPTAEAPVGDGSAITPPPLRLK
jgi:hypothetical protein